MSLSVDYISNIQAEPVCFAHNASKRIEAHSPRAEVTLYQDSYSLKSWT